jgi:hypothetical protein
MHLKIIPRIFLPILLNLYLTYLINYLFGGKCNLKSLLQINSDYFLKTKKSSLRERKTSI